MELWNPNFMPMESWIVKVRKDLLTQVIKGQWREVFCWTSYLQMTKNWPVMWRLGTAYSTVIMRWCSSWSWEKGTRQNAVSQPWTSGGQIEALFGRSQHNKVLEREGVQKSCLIFKDHLLKAQEWPIPTSWKSSKGNRSPSGMNKEILTKCKQKKEVLNRWKQGQVTQEEHTDTVLVRRGGVRQTKAHLELNLLRDVKSKGLLQVHEQRKEV